MDAGFATPPVATETIEGIAPQLGYGKLVAELGPLPEPCRWTMGNTINRFSCSLTYDSGHIISLVKHGRETADDQSSVEAVATEDSRLATRRGVRVGMTRAQVRARYGPELLQTAPDVPWDRMDDLDVPLEQRPVWHAGHDGHLRFYFDEGGKLEQIALGAEHY